jgi:hypothetical protein
VKSLQLLVWYINGPFVAHVKQDQLWVNELECHICPTEVCGSLSDRGSAQPIELFMVRLQKRNLSLYRAAVLIIDSENRVCKNKYL